MSDTTEETAEVTKDPRGHGAGPPSESSRAQVDLFGLSDKGLRREINEDHFLVARYGRFLDALYSNLPPGEFDRRFSEVGFGMVVADGLGGHAAGEHASRLAITKLVNLALETSDWVMRLDSESDVERVLRRARERFEKTSGALTAEADANPEWWGFGTTMTLAVSLARDLLIAHVGDSRAYLFRGNRLQQLTSDHTRGQELIDAGLIAPEDADSHKMRRCLTRILGDSVTRFQPTLQMLRLRSEDVLLLCSDGLTTMVDDAEIEEILAARQSAESTCRQLVDRSLEAGGKDNITIVVAAYRFPEVGTE